MVSGFTSHDILHKNEALSQKRVTESWVLGEIQSKTERRYGGLGQWLRRGPSSRVELHSL